MREGTEVGRTVGGVTSIEGQLVNSRACHCELFTHVFTRGLSFHHSGVNSSRARVRRWSSRKKTRVAATRLACTAVILDSSETTSGPVCNGGALKMYSYI